MQTKVHTDNVLLWNCSILSIDWDNLPPVRFFQAGFCAFRIYIQKYAEIGQNGTGKSLLVLIKKRMTMTNIISHGCRNKAKDILIICKHLHSSFKIIFAIAKINLTFK